MNSHKAKVKILYVVNHFRYHGGVEKMLSNKIDAWIEFYNYEVIVVTLNQENAEIVYLPKQPFRLIDMGIKKANQGKPADLFRFYKKLKNIMKLEKPDLLISTLTGLPSLLLPLIYPKVKKYLEVHSSGALSVTSSWKLKWPFLNRYNGVVLLNEDERQYYQLNNLHVIPNFVKPACTALDMPYKNRKKIIVAAGRIHADKQFDHLIKAWEMISDSFPEWTINIYGDGDKDLLKQYKEYILINKVERLQFLPATDSLDEILDSVSVFCLTSQTECFPMVLLECKNSALPAISYDSPNGPRHIIKNDGVLAEHNDIKGFAEKLSQLLKDDKKRVILSENAYNNRFIFSSSEIIKQWNNLL